MNCDVREILESPLGCMEIKLVNANGNQPWILIGRTDCKAEAPILWPSDSKNWLNGKYPNARNDWGQEKKGATVDEMVGWNHWLDGHEFEEALGAGDGQRSLACCSPWGCKESDMMSDWTELNWYTYTRITLLPHFGGKKSLFYRKWISICQIIGPMIGN